MRKTKAVSKVFEDRKKKNTTVKAIAIATIILALAVVAFAEVAEKNIDFVVCEFFATKDNYTEFSPDFRVEVDLERGFLWNLENGMTEKQKNILFTNAKRFYENKQTVDFDAAGMICRDNTNAKVKIIIEK